MAVEVWELHTSRTSTEGEDATVEQHWMLQGTDDDCVAKDLLKAASPAIYDGLIRKSWRVEPEGYLLWRGTVQYGRFSRPQQEGDSPKITFDTGGGTIHVSHAISQVGAYKPTGLITIPSNGLVGVTNDGVEGVDIPSREFHWSETHILPISYVSHDYAKTLYELTGTVNNDAWRSYAAGEVLFKNASGSAKDADTCEITYSFAASPNLTNLSIGGVTVLSKQGWDYLWIRYEEELIGSALTKKVRMIYVDRVIERKNFSLLGIT